ncbi:uncharacterized protein LOC114946224 [Nylanderia fulva]|uniref:uncharacterized protein LOC114946224 n=2 Tax=Nylanderia fulva TaxID=613905 RepID=UPI0010FAF937|nr:uncharacterized protein LOC114946224 [Nylanderia fulva]
MVRKLDAESLKRWEDSLGAKTDPPSFADFETFLISRIYTLEALERSLPRKQQINSSTSRPSGARSYIATAPEQKCVLCAAGHYLSSCSKYLEKPYDQRRGLVLLKNLCFNCLGPHQLKMCRNTKRCRICRKQHHTTLHAPNSNSDTVANITPAASISAAQPTAHASTLQEAKHTNQLNINQSQDYQASSHLSQSRTRRRAPALLATAVVRVLSRHDQSSQLRALLDQGSEVSFISESAAQSLKLPRRSAAIPIVGIGAQRNSVSNGIVQLRIASLYDSSIYFEIDALVLPKLTAYIPPAQLEYKQWPHIQNLQLADPNFATPGKIDLVLGSIVYAQVLKQGLCRGPIGAPIAQNTALGWILSGPLSTSEASIEDDYSLNGMQCSLDSELLDLLQRFWSQEEIIPRPQVPLTPEESQCETHFESTHSRDIQGRFVVRLPLKRNISDFGDSRTFAQNALLRMERRFNSNPSLKSAYSDFLREYHDLDHMRIHNSSEKCHQREFFLPHRDVTRETSATTKLRVVFNGSQKTTLGFSLNDVLHVGPKLQTDLSDILIRWRRHQYVFAADIEKMYRQIRVHEDDWPLQKILWRNDPSETPQEYHLCTVTYGLACAPYLALRCLQQLAFESDSPRALAAEILRRDTYVDDVLSGASSISEAKTQINQLNESLIAGGFHLRKWISNDPEVLADIPHQDQASSPILSVDDRTIHHTLGVQWHQQSDRFVFSAPSPPPAGSLTKRSVLSFTASMFDPLGWLAPIVIVAKMFMQELWAIRLDWDEELPENLKSRWINFTQQLENVTTISIPRWVGITTSSLAIELHGFSDASQNAIAAVVYLRVINEFDDIYVTLISAKTKVAPLKRMTIPRLELSAAVILVRLVFKIRNVLQIHHTSTHLWTDSTVALTWIKGHPSRWKDFVQNRVSFIQELSNSRWHHVSGTENPADLASRGIPPHSLPHAQLWWKGPSWLQHHSSSWPSLTPKIESTINLEERPVSCTLANEKPEVDLGDLIERYSSLTSLLRTTAWLLRAFERFRKSTAHRPHQAVLTPSELESALLLWVKLTQQAYFSKEFRTLRNNKQLSPSSSLLKLSPVLDETGHLRLRGRLHFSQLEPSEKHPLILPRDSRLTTLIIDYYHRRSLHGGPQLTLSLIRHKFWIIGGRTPIRSFIHNCITCARHRAAASQQLIGQLPASRVTPCRPFFNTGVDYAGPLTLKSFRGRGAKTVKGYFIIFVCFSTSAVHLEVATDYSTDGFLAAYKRFTGRRGLCSTITSDCGTNFVGAASELKKLFTASSKEWAHIANILANDGVKWSFNPPSAPHFGGKWEAGVKSVKHHLRRVIGETLLTYEELSTLLIQIEAILNSRPLSALSDDPSDSVALTPGHFLVGNSLTAVPEPSLIDLPQNRLSRLQMLRQMTESFWRRWSSEYLHELQTSSKWHRKQEKFQEGSLVIVKDERFPPTKWPLARIIETHPGSDGLVRVATVKTATTTLKRPIVKLCLLPNVTKQ